MKSILIALAIAFGSTAIAAEPVKAPAKQAEVKKEVKTVSYTHLTLPTKA